MKKAVCLLGVLLVISLVAVGVETIPYAAMVVSKTVQTDLASDVDLTTLLTPNNTHDYIVTLYATALSCPTGNSSLRVTLNWTDEIQPESTVFTPGPGGTGVPSFSDIRYIHAIGGVPIQYSVVYNAGTSSCAYDMTLTLVKE